MNAPRTETPGNPGGAPTFQPYPETLDNPPDDVVLLDDGRFWFKQDSGLFKQVLDGGKVIGLLYRKQRDGGDWTALGAAQVRSRCEIYRRRAQGEGSEAARRGAACWAWALSLFEAVPARAEAMC